MTARPTIPQLTSALAGAFGGQLLGPGDDGYEEARRVHNGLVDKRPALIARCRNEADVVHAVRLAHEAGLEVAVRGGGHNVAGRATIDGGIMIDLSLMKRIDVDPSTRTVRAQGGVTWGELNRATERHGLAVTGGIVSTTGIAGLTLGGGLGWLMGKHGLALDNLESVSVVSAEGNVLRASSRDDAELFWAVRGGGGNFGIATSFEYRLHPLDAAVVAGLLVHPFERAREVLQFYRERTVSLPDDHTIFATLTHAPDGSGTKVAAMATLHCGAPAIAEAAMDPLKRFGSPLLDTVGPVAYADFNEMMDGNYPKGAFNYWKSSFLSELTSDAIDCMIECFAQCPGPTGQLVIEHIHGAATRVGTSDTAFPHRKEGYNFLVLAQWLDAGSTPAHIKWARETYARMNQFVAAARYVNYLDDDEAGDAVAAAYGANYPRLRALKTRYDPHNFFRLNQNILPLP